MERILQFADSKTTGERWIFFSENVRKCVNNAAFSNIHNLFSERVNTTFFAVNNPPSSPNITRTCTGRCPGPAKAFRSAQEMQKQI